MKEYPKSRNGSYCHNNYIHSTPGRDGPIFSQNETEFGHDDVIVHLNGYAIIPLEQYAKLVPETDFSEIITKAKQAEKILNPAE